MFECLYLTSFVFLDSFSILIFLVSKYFSLSTFKFCVCVCVCVCLSNCYAYLWMSGCLESPLDVIVIYLFVKILLLPVISVCCYTYVHITRSHILASIYSVYKHSRLCYIMLYEYSYLKVESVLNGGAEVATLLSHTNFERMRTRVVEDD